MKRNEYIDKNLPLSIRYQPQDSEVWDAAYEKWQKIIASAK